jgi:hypothetical protein
MSSATWKLDRASMTNGPLIRRKIATLWTAIVHDRKHYTENTLGKIDSNQVGQYSSEGQVL